MSNLPVSPSHEPATLESVRPSKRTRTELFLEPANEYAEDTPQTPSPREQREALAILAEDEHKTERLTRQLRINLGGLLAISRRLAHQASENWSTARADFHAESPFHEVSTTLPALRDFRATALAQHISAEHTLALFELWVTRGLRDWQLNLEVWQARSAEELREAARQIRSE